MSEHRHILRPQDVLPERPDGFRSRARVAVVVSLNFPGMDEQKAELVLRFTRVALRTLQDLGAEVELVDTSVPTDPGIVLRCDGLLLLGGGDIAPSCYGAPDTELVNSYGVDERADRDALAAITVAEGAGLPVIGICRGSQLINVHRGGTIVPDIEDHALHRGGPGQPLFLDEKIGILPGTRLHSILDADHVVARSGHHQAVDRVGRDLVVAARALDGVIEAVEDPSRWVVGVQWHPEDDDGPAEVRERLLGAFVDACTSNDPQNLTTERHIL